MKGHFFFFLNNNLPSYVFYKRPNLSLCSKAFMIYDSLSWKIIFQVHAK